MGARDRREHDGHAKEIRSARQAALAALADLRLDRHVAGESVEAIVGRFDLLARERSLAIELAKGVVQHRLTLAAVLDPLAANGWKRIPRTLQHVLLVGAYQLLWLDGIPAFAAVAEAVDQARSRGGERSARFVNAVLRQLQREIEQRRLPASESDPRRGIPIDAAMCCQFHHVVLPDPAHEPIDHLSISTSHPLWLVARWVKTFGIETARQIGMAGICRPATTLRPNPLRIDAAALADRLRAEGVDTDVDTATQQVAVRHGTPVTHTACFAEGLFQIQDQTAMSVVREMNPQPGQTVIDLCAGAGTKTTHIAELMNNVGCVLASDKDETRLAAVRENCRRLGLTIVRTVLPAELEAMSPSLGSIDWILVDAPCSNTGVLARRPEARYHVSGRTLRELADLQLQLLTRAARMAHGRTRLLYSTCSLEPEENEQVLTRWVQSIGSWRLQDSRRTFPSVGSSPASWHDGGFWAILHPC